MQLEKVYEPGRFEPHWAQWWVSSGIYEAKAEPGKPVFSLVIPPPNVTGSLHMGHMLEHTEIDVTVRWHRMRGDNTLWLPGTDHAGIATADGGGAPACRRKASSTAATWAARNSKSASGSGRRNTAAPSNAR